MRNGVCVGQWLALAVLGGTGCAGQSLIGGLDSDAAGASGLPREQSTVAAGAEGTMGGAANAPGGSSSAGEGSTEGGTGGGSAGSTGEFIAGDRGTGFSCSDVRSQQFDPASMHAYSVSKDVTAEVDSVLAAMDGSARAQQMMGVDGTERNYQDIERSPDVDVPGVGTIRGFRYRDGARGVNLDAAQDNRSHDGGNFATVFPAPSVRAASWDLELERRVGMAIGDETAASRNNVLLAPCINVVRHPYWGRTQETYGEDTYHIGRMATAFTVGVQQYVVACATHFAANNIEKGRTHQNAIMNEQTLREIYGRHFEMVVQDGGVGCVVASYNMINDVKSTLNQHLLRDILKAPIEQNGFGFQGFVISDWWAMPGDQMPPDAATAQSQTNEAVMAGLDIEVPWTLHYSTATLAKADPLLVEEAARRVLTQKYRFTSALDTDGWSIKPPTSTLTGDGSIATNEAHEALAEEVEVKSAVLLSNGLGSSRPVLPLASATNIAVVGPDRDFTLVSSSVPTSCEVEGEGPSPGRSCTFHFAIDPALGDRGSSRVDADPRRAVGPLAGIEAAAPATATVTSGNSADAAAAADAVVVVVGYTPGDEGEEYPISTGGDRSSLDLPPGHDELVDSVLDLNKPTVIIIESGSIVNMPWLTHANQHQATIWAGYPGLRGGLALGKLIFGKANFSGKMPMAWPTQAELPAFEETDTQTTMGYFFGYREYDKRKYVDGTSFDLVFPFGHGLSYSSFEYSNLSLPCREVTKEAIFAVSVDIKNTSKVDGDEVAMLFLKLPSKPAGITGERPWKELKSFARVSVPAGETVTAELPLRVRDLRRWEGGANGRWVIDSGDYTILVGKNAEDAETSTLRATVTVKGD
jgi:beta-glucosidase